MADVEGAVAWAVFRRRGEVGRRPRRSVRAERGVGQRAPISDEGGRGLHLVARLTLGWGTRQTPTGKTIWAGQALRAGLRAA
ncbi:hypothetical protein AB0M29_19330 [Streptomyces sp. NPDC051976]|uniref:hypothetical protein n=1 Tax=Streptomyces sp. NPDC051976 TaxID=3154947 RepID=UPI00344389B7